MAKRKVSKKDKFVIESVAPKPKTVAEPTTIVTTGKINRYLVRNSLFRLRDDRVEDGAMVQAIYEIIRKQLKPNENLHNFTFSWDVNPKNPLEVMRRADWDKVKEEKYPLQYKKQELVEEEITLFTGQK